MSSQLPGAEHRLVTILFADVAGSTALGETVDAETIRLILDRCLRRMSEAVDEYGGTVARLMGDGLLAFFGAPLAHEDDPERAALTALEIHRRVETYAAEIHQPLQVRVGINTGRVVMGELGSEILSEYTAMGQPVNVAARLQEAAEAGTTLLGEVTARLVRHQFEVEPVDAMRLKGFDEAVEAYRLLAARAEPEPARGMRGLASPLVGRDSERAQLNEAVAGLSAGRGAIVSLIGEPGIGKSRLLYETRTENRELGLRWAEGRAYSYSEGQPYGVVRGLLSELLDLSPDDTPAILDLKLERGLTPLFGERVDDIWAYLAVLLGAPVPPSQETFVGGLDAEALSRKIETAFVDTVEAFAKHTPTIVSFDDLHWADPTSLSLLRALFLSTERSPLLIVLLFRPERDKPVWELKTVAEREFGHRYLELTLMPLDEASSQRLIDNLLAVSELPADLRTLIQDKSEGNPFFVEELVRELIEVGVLARKGDAWKVSRRVGGLRVPETLQEVVQARVDRLPRSERSTLQAASVLGRHFLYGLLQAIAPPDGELSIRLLNLQRADLIRERARLPEPEYAFKHSVVHEVTYSSLVSEQRRELHLLAGETLEKLFVDRLEENAAMIARHYSLAGEDGRALNYHKLAGDAGFRVYANTEAAEHYASALDLARRRPYDRELFVHLYLRRGRAQELDALYDEALQTYEDMHALAVEVNDPHLRLQALLHKLTLFVTPTPMLNSKVAREVAEQALELGRELDEPPAEARILWNLSLLERFTNSPDQGTSHGERSLEIARRLNLREQTGFTLHDLYWSYLGTARFAEAREAIEEARSIWQDLGNLPLLADSYSSAVFLHYLSGELEEAVEAAGKAGDISVRIDNLWGQSFSKLYTGLVYSELGEYGRAFEEMAASLEFGKLAGFVVPGAVIPALMALAYASLGDMEESSRIIESVLKGDLEATIFTRPFIMTALAEVQIRMGKLQEAGETLQKKFPDYGLLRTAAYLYPESLPKAHLALAQGELEDAGRIASALVSELQTVKSRIYVADALLVKGDAEIRLGQMDEARRTLQTAFDDGEALGSRRTLWRAARLLGQAEDALGNTEVADALRSQARDIIAYIADHAGSEHLKASFLGQEEVKEVLRS